MGFPLHRSSRTLMAMTILVRMRRISQIFLWNSGECLRSHLQSGQFSKYYRDNQFFVVKYHRNRKFKPIKNSGSLNSWNKWRRRAGGQLRFVLISGWLQSFHILVSGIPRSQGDAESKSYRPARQEGIFPVISFAFQMKI